MNTKTVEIISNVPTLDKLSPFCEKGELRNQISLALYPTQQRVVFLN